MDQQVKNSDSITELLATELMGSDTAYFESAAVIEEIEAASIARMPALESLAAATVVQRVKAELLPADLASWIFGIEKRLSVHATTRSRIYLQYPIPRLERALHTAGYQSRNELAVVLAAGPVRALHEGVSIRPLRTDADWEKKLELHQSNLRGPDGHRSEARDWVRMEQLKCAAGYMYPFLICLDGEIVGAVNGAPYGSLLRLKNLVVAENSRLNRIGRKTLELFAGVATKEGKSAVGAFVLEGDLFARMYAPVGYNIVGQQTEWVRELV